MNTRKAYQNVIGIILAVISFMSLMGMACDEGPNPSEIIINAAVPTQQNILSGGN